MFHKKGQVWIETVLYALIGLALIGVTLSIVMPRINESKDRVLVEQSIELLNILDSRIIAVLDRGAGNIRKINDFRMKEGEIYINATGDEIFLILEDLSSSYSEPGVPIRVGRVDVLSKEGPKASSVRLSIGYKGVVNITYGGKDILKKFSATGVPYKFSIENKGNWIDISE